MTAICEKIKEYSFGEYTDNDSLNEHFFYPHFSTLVINSLNVHVTVSVFDCPLVKAQDQRIIIKLTTLPKAYTPPIPPENETPVILLECRPDNKCYFRSILLIRNANTTAPEIMKPEDSITSSINIPYLNDSEVKMAMESMLKYLSPLTILAVFRDICGKPP